MTKWAIDDVGKNASKVKRALRVRHGWKNLRMVVILGGMEKKGGIQCKRK